VLLRVERDSAFAVAALEAELSRAAQLEARDRALATELVYGVLRVRPWLEQRIGRHATRGIHSIEPAVRAHLLVAAYQLFFLRVPAFAAVNECVDAVRALTRSEIAGFANAVLRKLAAESEASRPVLSEVVLASAPPWLRAALRHALGEEGAAAFLAAGADVPPNGLRVEDPAGRDAWMAKLAEAAPRATILPGRVSPHALLGRGLGRLTDLPGWGEGAWSAQEEGSQVVALALGARAGDRVLDACAGRGNKTAMLARAVGADGAVDAADLHPSKLERLVEELGRVHLSARRTFAVDWTVGAGDADVYDRALVDAPCSGVGTLRRRPALATRRAQDDVRALADLHAAIVARVAERVRPGGRLVYAVCSVLREEAEEVVARLQVAVPSLEPAPFESEAARALAGDAPELRLLPHVHGTDGYFVASFRKEG